MGREQRRREQFNNKNKKVESEELDTSIKWETIIKLVCFVIILLFVVYYVLAVFVTKEIDISNGNANNSSSEELDSSNNSINDKILASNIFNQKEDSYYVYFYDFKDENEVASGAVASITDTVYRVDTSSSLNANYITEETGNNKAKSIDELKVKSPTLIKISGDKIVEYYEGSNNIYEGLN